MAGELPDVKIKIDLDTSDALRALSQIEERVRRGGLGIQSLSVASERAESGMTKEATPATRKKGQKVAADIKKTTRGTMSTLRSANVPDLYKMGVQTGISVLSGAVRMSGMMLGAAASVVPALGAVARGFIVRGSEGMAQGIKIAGNAIAPWLEFGAPAAMAAGTAALERFGIGPSDIPGGEAVFGVVKETIETISNDITELRAVTKGLQHAVDNTLGLLKASVGTDQMPSDAFIENFAETSYNIGSARAVLDANIKKVFMNKGSAMIGKLAARAIKRMPGH